MYSNLIIHLFLLIALGLSFLSCDTIEPPPLEQTKSYEYVWSIDTLRNPHGYGVVPWSMWGTSPNDIWIAGFNLAGQGEIFHYSGQKWTRVTPDLGFNYEVASVFGFSANDIYVVGSKLIIDSVLRTDALILHFDGVTWHKEAIPFGNGLKYIHGQTNDDIWACGYYGEIYHKSGGVWNKLDFNKREYLGLLSEAPDLGPIYVAPNGEIFVMNEYYNYKVYGETAMFYFSKYSNNKWQDLDSCRLGNVDGIAVGHKFGNRTMWGNSAAEIYSAGTGVFKFDGTKWQAVYWDDYEFLDVKSTKSGIIIGVGLHGSICHYYKNDWMRLPGFYNQVVDFYSVMPFDDDIFIGAFQFSEGYVVHGKKKYLSED